MNVLFVTAKPTAPITNATTIEPTTREFDPSKVNIENKNYIENAIGEIGCPVMLKSIDVSSQCIKVVTESAYKNIQSVSSQVSIGA